MGFKRDIYAKYACLLKNYFALIGGKPEARHYDDGSFQPLKECHINLKKSANGTQLRLWSNFFYHLMT